MDAPLERRRFLAVAGVTPLFLARDGERDAPHVVNRRLKSVAEVERLNGWICYETLLDSLDRIAPDVLPDDETFDPNEMARDADDERLGKAALVAVGGDEVDDDWLRHLAAFDGLRRLILPYARINGAGFRHLIDCRRLESIWLDRTPIDNDGLMQLAQLGTLRTIMIMGHTHVTTDGVERLKSFLRNTHIVVFPTDRSAIREW